ncbi:MAG TPA: zinc ribbon domain-containing protein [Dehalococcoidia bacterium]|nr:zinc ribbon domain-containing protein [Dehalococcoidia bacterium]
MTEADDRATELGRRAGRLLKQSRPRIKRLVEANRPKVEQAGKQAYKLAQEHEDELRAMALKGLRLRAGPLAGAFDALTSQPGSRAASEPVDRACPACSADNPPAAKFCNQCGTQLTPTSS